MPNPRIFYTVSIQILMIVAASVIPTNTYAQTPIVNQCGDTGLPGKVSFSDIGLDVQLEKDSSEKPQAMFKVSFLDAGTKNVHKHIDYTFEITDNNGTRIFNAAPLGQPTLHTAEGVVTIPYVFQSNIGYTVTVIVYGINFVPTIPHVAMFPCKETTGPDGANNNASSGYVVWVVRVDGNLYHIRYFAINATILDMTINNDTKSLIVLLSSGHQKGELQLELTRDIIDAKDQDEADVGYNVFIDGSRANFEEVLKTERSRFLTIPLESDAKQITITGTQVVPEFAPYIMITALISMIGAAIVLGSVNRNFKARM